MPNSSFTPEERESLIFLAKKSIESKLLNNGSSASRRITTGGFDISERSINGNLKAKRASFVTLTIDGRLRGCIGNILPVQELYKDVMENAQNSAFCDPRFLPLSISEFKNTEIEISVLSIPKKLDYHTPEELIEYLKKNKPGVIIRKGNCGATFLPQVWEEIETPEEFLGHLCLKAGLSSDEWKKGIEVQVYEAEKIK